MSRPTKEIENLVVTAKLHIGLERDGIISLNERIEEFVDADRQIVLKAVPEVLALHHPRHRILGAEPYHIRGVYRLEPFAVIPDLCLVGIKDLENLFFVRFRIRHDLVFGERRTGLDCARRVADHSREIADKKNGHMPEFLELLELLENDRMP